ncbi:putative ATP-binding protein [Trypanosoma theileri]|uniref:Diphthine--ammonia ligase n=1 Tax=Trypanosoma theileri TaxID=67003 RepID=A0A1X0P4I2_9TRYP|nr:putative ATP-binding protein [Trypanosoma theileri]ORC91847.1 putative ATP-binding protein [Trypanosoma theileri]
MKTIALISGGKDGILSMLLALRYGHEPVVVANIAPMSSEESQSVDEIDSYSFQTVGHEVVESIAVCLKLPLRRAFIKAGQSKVQELHYTSNRDDEDEIECLYRLLRSVKEEFPEVRGVTTGAILSHYQRNRVEDVCSRLGLESLAFLWKRPADEVLDIVSTLHVRAILVKTASIGLNPKVHLGMSLEDVRPVLDKAQEMYGTHSAGEGGEFETIVLDCPLFKEQRLEVVSLERVIVDDNEYSPSGHARLKVRLIEKNDNEKNADIELLKSLPSLIFPSDRMKFLPRAENILRTSFELLESSAIPMSSENDSNFWGRMCDTFKSNIYTNYEQLIASLVNLLKRIVEKMEESKRDIFFVLIFSPSLDYLNAFKEVFTQIFSGVRPPGYTFVEKSELTELRFDVLSAPTSLIDRALLHVRSISCWGAASMDICSTSNAITIEKERHVLVSGSIGLIPVSQLLASVKDMPELETVTFSHFSNIIKLEEDVIREFIVQFAFTYANSVIGLTHFGANATDATHATFFLTDMRFAPLLPFLWHWCTNSVSRLVYFDINLHPCVSTDSLVLYRVVHVTRLPFDSAVGLILEQRLSLSED